MRVNDIVKVHDGSYNMSLVRGAMQHITGSALRERQFRVLGTDGKYPTNTVKYHPDWSGTNDILLVDVKDSDFVLFSQERFCSVVTPYLRETTPPTKPVEITVPYGTKQIHLFLL